MACGKQYKNERKADKAVTRCDNSGFSCEEVAERARVSLRKGRLPAVMDPRYAGPMGRVLIAAEFDESGRFAQARVVESPSGYLSRLAMEAIRTWQVYPSCPGGVPVRQNGTIPLEFGAMP